jgi:signal transduction histidine kinase
VRTERELNEFIAHEVRNPLASAIAALSFVFRLQGALQDERVGKPCGMTFISSIQAAFINEVRNMLDVHRSGFDNNIDEYQSH